MSFDPKKRRLSLPETQDPNDIEMADSTQTLSRFNSQYPRKNYFSKKLGYNHILKDAKSLATYGYKRPTDAQKAQRHMDGVGRYKRRRYRRSYRGRGMYDGAGSYDGHVEANAIVNGVADTFQVPAFSQHNDNGIVISHKEYLQDMYGGATSAFVNKSIPINPGLAASFPWLSQIAQNYEEYDMIQCLYTFRTTSTDITSSSGQIASVIMATQYNVNLAPFSNKTTMMEYDGAMSSKVTLNQVHGVECDDNKRSGTQSKYVRASPVDDGELKEYDWGNFNIAVANTPLTNVNQCIGELWVSYTVRLLKPKLFTQMCLGNRKDIFYSTANLVYTAPAPGLPGVTWGNIWGSPANIGGVLPTAGPPPTLMLGPQVPSTSLPGVLAGYYNNLGCLLSNDNLNAATAPTNMYLRITFPGSLSANLRIIFKTTGTNITGAAPDAAPIVQGNVVIQADQYGATQALGTDTASLYMMCPNFAATNNCNSIAYEIHVAVSTATAGIENSIWFYAPSLCNFGRITNCCVEIEAMNFNNGGRQNNSPFMALPVLVNVPTQQIVVPT